MSRWRWILNRLGKRLWLRATLIGLLGVAAAIMAALVERYIPWDLPTNIGADAVGTILNIIASSMLAVTTFSLSVMTAAFGAATTNVTPRATRLLIEDRLTQTVLSTFIGAFLFGIVGIVVLSTGAYGDRGRFVLFVITVGVIVLIVASLLRWIDHLTRFGRVGETTARVEQAAERSIVDRLGAPYLGGRRMVDLPANGYPITAPVIGYVQHIDVGALQTIAEDIDQDIYVDALPGTFVYSDTPVAWLAEAPTEEESPELQERLLKAITIGTERSFDQDPRFALSVMSEIGSRALSPATNDPGTAIDVIGRMTRLMSLWAASCESADIEPVYPRVHVPALRTDDLFEDAFMLLGRDGAGLIEVQLRLQKSLLALSRWGDSAYRAAALAMAHEARDRAEAALTLEADRARLRALYMPGG
ncbi:DUF2254 domain-containing protein [Bordetella sp. 02P26C-1]|uniref:DUF2254 domain-containing protein n=1 Tax=Bordetella sp. 02P26C-1 TaxID=2683195 RepID=UPI0013533148|nr:DUF2254 domain-containing protein [Bordetella sp. 02P26C-1]MVW78094.1 DUF2254 domain-containing protein [Bordetella sp. 02P26C-1]